MGRWYQVVPAPIQGGYKLKIPGERATVVLPRKTLEKYARAYFGLNSGDEKLPL
ncbi:hypothetical protein [Dryocola sp. BD613]|uniref:hypothetical protein n=1 Tax=Dryocola sp. BD613 TaxID=3133272 RepID=UPI003F4FEBB1